MQWQNCEMVGEQTAKWRQQAAKWRENELRNGGSKLHAVAELRNGGRMNCEMEGDRTAKWRQNELRNGGSKLHAVAELRNGGRAVKFAEIANVWENPSDQGMCFEGNPSV
jgi:hypothetical protein